MLNAQQMEGSGSSEWCVHSYSQPFGAPCMRGKKTMGRGVLCIRQSMLFLPYKRLFWCPTSFHNLLLRSTQLKGRYQTQISEITLRLSVELSYKACDDCVMLRVNQGKHIQQRKTNKLDLLYFALLTIALRNSTRFFARNSRQGAHLDGLLDGWLD